MDKSWRSGLTTVQLNLDAPQMGKSSNIGFLYSIEIVHKEYWKPNVHILQEVLWLSIYIELEGAKCKLHMEVHTKKTY